MRDTTEPPQDRLSRLPQKPRATFDDVVLPGLAITSGGLLFAAMPNLIDAQDILDYVKSGLVAVAATAVAYGVNKLAIIKGTVQAAIGTRGALFVSTASISVVGFGLFTSTVAGLTLGKVDELRLSEYLQDMAIYAAAETDTAQKAARIEPALRTIAVDFKHKTACERLSSCISGRGSGGEGTVYRATNAQHQLASSVLAEVTSGARARDRHLAALTDLQSTAQGVIFDDALTPSEQRAALQDITIRFDQSVAALRESVPTSLAVAYADDLLRGVAVPGRPDAAVTLSGIMRGHGQTLGAVVASAKTDLLPAPRLPAKAGVSDSLSYLGHFLPIAMIVAVVELVFPITLWLYTYFGLCAQIERNAPSPSSPKPNRPRRGRKSGEQS
ncbi:hypothetical protein [uncultured Roseobacter sp.]|uniref:hypothetical protein n=1 Tax=uncultured Roseobacter sp. TaxID=114847 RepID=UPI00261364A0|nr:hypothetical protein [uncultured Roseobacter sp.]